MRIDSASCVIHAAEGGLRVQGPLFRAWEFQEGSSIIPSTWPIAPGKLALGIDRLTTAECSQSECGPGPEVSARALGPGGGGPLLVSQLMHSPLGAPPLTGRLVFSGGLWVEAAYSSLSPGT